MLFYEEKKRESMKALQHLELIDDEADLFGIRSHFSPFNLLTELSRQVRENRVAAPG